MGRYMLIKRVLAFGSGVAVLYASIIFSRNGFEFKTDRTLAWVGVVLALAATSSEMMLNSSFQRLNWTIIALGISAYLYSIWTNIIGFQVLRADETPWSVIGVIGGLFLDIYPEIAIAWSLEESKVGDLIGNIIKTIQGPEKVTEQVPNGFHPINQKSTYKAKHRPAYKPQLYTQGSFDDSEDD